LLSLFLL